MVDTETPGFAPVRSTRFATILSGRHMSAETGYSSLSGIRAAVKHPW